MAQLHVPIFLFGVNCRLVVSFLPFKLTAVLYIVFWIFHVVVLYHITIVTIGQGLDKDKKFWPIVIVLRTAGSYLYLKLCRLVLDYCFRFTI